MGEKGISIVIWFNWLFVIVDRLFLIALGFANFQMFTVTATDPCRQPSNIYLYFSVSFFSVSSSYDPSLLLFLLSFIYFLQNWTLEKPVILWKSF